MASRPQGNADEHHADPHRILVAIAGRQHADQLAAGMVEGGWDATLLLTNAVRPQLADILADHNERYGLIGLVFRGANRILPRKLAEWITHRMFTLFDRLVSRRLTNMAPQAVVAYETSALDIFRAARTLGIPTILDAASVHHHLQQNGDVASPLRQEINARKDMEIALADHILCCSDLAAQSYIAAGVPADRVHAVPLGFDPGVFRPASDDTPHTGPLRIAFAGRFTRVKGADVLADALDIMRREGLEFECRVAAARADGDGEIARRLAENASLVGKLSQHALADLYRWADILVMPSRFDSFGLVLLEALACGLPVIASDHVGAASFITPDSNGDIVPAGDAPTLAARLMDCARNPTRVRAMRAAAFASSQGAEWSQYRIRARRTVAEILSWPASL